MTAGFSLAAPIRHAAPPDRLRLGAALQGGLIMLTLAVCLVLPRSGQGVLLVPLGSDARPMAPHDGVLAGQTLLGRGLLPGSILIRPAGPVPIWALLRDGILPIGVPLALCGQPGEASLSPRNAPLQTRGSHG